VLVRMNSKDSFIISCNARIASHSIASHRRIRVSSAKHIIDYYFYVDALLDARTISHYARRPPARTHHTRNRRQLFSRTTCKIRLSIVLCDMQATTTPVANSLSSRSRSRSPLSHSIANFCPLFYWFIFIRLNSSFYFKFCVSVRLR
jgi:hypothetical protein